MIGRSRVKAVLAVTVGVAVSAALWWWMPLPEPAPFGQVVDREGKPLAGVEIALSAESFMVAARGEGPSFEVELQAVTDDAGNFQLNWTGRWPSAGMRMKVLGVTKSGYLFMPAESTKLGLVPPPDENPARERPHVLVMRERGESGLVVKIMSGADVPANGGWWEFDPLGKKALPEDADDIFRSQMRGITPLFKIACISDEANGELVLNIAMMDESDGGLQVSELDLGNAPMDGYETAIEVRGELPALRHIGGVRQPSEVRYLYVRDTKRSVYMKITLSTVRLDPRFMQPKHDRSLRRSLAYAPGVEIVSVGVWTWVNALGGRGFEPDPKLEKIFNAMGGPRLLHPWIWDDWWNVHRPELLEKAELTVALDG